MKPPLGPLFYKNGRPKKRSKSKKSKDKKEKSQEKKSMTRKEKVGSYYNQGKQNKIKKEFRKKLRLPNHVI